MYAQVQESKNKGAGCAVANRYECKPNAGKQSTGFVDNRLLINNQLSKQMDTHRSNQPSSGAGVMQGVFLDSGTVELAKEHMEMVKRINLVVNDMLGNDPGRLSWMENLGEDIKLDLLRQVINSTNTEVIEGLCNGLIRIPFDSSSPPPMTDSFVRELCDIPNIPDITTSERVTPINVLRDYYHVKHTSPEGGEIDVSSNQEDKLLWNHVIFRQLVENNYDFIIVHLPDLGEYTISAFLENISKPIRFQGKNYYIHQFAGSMLKLKRAIGIEEGAYKMFEKTMGFEESVYYGQRAFLPKATGGVTGSLKVKTVPVDPEGRENLFHLKDGTPVQVHDGWGYVTKSMADQMEEGGLSIPKRTTKPSAGHSGYQMMQWFTEDNKKVIDELVSSGMTKWKKLETEEQQLKKRLEKAEAAGEASETGEIQEQLNGFIRKKYSLLTTGGPRLEMAVAMPVPGSNLVLPTGSERFSQQEGGGVALTRSPADVFNWNPVEKENIENNEKMISLVSDIEGIQYTLTGTQGDELTFFKGMLGVIPDKLWPNAWGSMDLVVCSKDRKLFESWKSEEQRKMTQSRDEEFTLSGSLVSVQWFNKGSFVGVPNEMMEWLGGDYDGDEVAILFQRLNPELFMQINSEFSQNQINAKLTKTFTYKPQSDRGSRILNLMSPLVSKWSNIAAQLNALHREDQFIVANAVALKSSLLPPEEQENLTLLQKMWKEVQLGIKVGTDLFKTSVNAQEFEQRAQFYIETINKKLKGGLPYTKSLMNIINQHGAPDPHNPDWQKIWQTLDRKRSESIYIPGIGTKSQDAGYLLPGIPAQVMREMLKGFGFK
jgi:hypothetical protein